MRAAPLLALAVVLAGCTSGTGPAPAPPTTPPPGPPSQLPAGSLDTVRIALEPAVRGLVQPVFAGHAGDGSGRVFLVEQAGRITAWTPGQAAPLPFLDLVPLVGSGGERGLLGLAFDPDFAENGRFFVHYTDRAGNTVLARYTTGAATGLGDPLSAKVLLQVVQPYANHNGGMLAFGPDGMLYFALGDGGSAGDPQGNGQRLDTLLGKLLRLDVRGDGYAVPDDNPFAGRSSARNEIWAYGLRNPWRFSFDRATGDLYIGDVGQNAVEEIDFQAANATGGANYGWNLWEGTRRFEGGDSPPTVAPIAEVSHQGGHCSITGGYVYRGEAIPALRGVYLFGDYCSGVIWGLQHREGAWRMRELLDTEASISSFGEDEDGELYVVDHGGEVLRVVAG